MQNMGKRKIVVQRENSRRKLSDIMFGRSDSQQMEDYEFQKLKDGYNNFLEAAKNRPFQNFHHIDDDNFIVQQFPIRDESEMEQEDPKQQQSQQFAPDRFSLYNDDSSEQSVPLMRVQLENCQQSESETFFKGKLPIKISPFTAEVKQDSDDDFSLIKINIQKQNLQDLLNQRPYEQLAEDDESIFHEESLVSQKKSKKIYKKKGTKLRTNAQQQSKQAECKYLACINSLQENAIPEEILCRDQEKANIRQFIQSGIKQGGQQQVLYLSGVPGIGKTASVLEVKERMLMERQNFQFVHINAMNFGVAESVYQYILEAITGISKVTRHQACIILNELFMKGRLPKQYKKAYVMDIPTVMLVDECDNLLTSNQQVLYNLLDWPSHKQSKLIVIFIANTMDFPEKLKPKLQSRMGNNRVVFKPYTSAQIQQIIVQRLKKSSNVFLQRACEFVGKKVASVSTDIRRALQVCRISVEIAKEKREQVDIPHIKEAYCQVYDKPFHACIRKFPRNLKLLMITIALEIHLKSIQICSLFQIIPRFKQFQQILGDQEFLCYEELKEILQKLKLSNLVEIREQNQFKNAGYNNISDLNIQPKFTADDLKNALEEDDLFNQFSYMF